MFEVAINVIMKCDHQLKTLVDFLVCDTYSSATYYLPMVVLGRILSFNLKR